MQINQALCRVASESKAKEVRFWGKILGCFQDYYVIQGVRDPPKSHDPLSMGQEKAGEGVNYYSFWVTNDPIDKWVELPNITPEHVKISRKVKRLFSGNLENPVNVYPSFPGCEKHYVRGDLSLVKSPVV